MRARRMQTLATLTLLCVALVPVCRAQARPQLPDEWLGGPERRDFPWKVQVLPPRLMFQQRYLVQVRADIPVDVSQKGSVERDLHFLLKVANEQGQWLPGDNYNHFSVPSHLDSETEIQFTAGMYLRPGNYLVALLVYDSVHRDGNVWRKPLRVKPPAHDPLPQLDRDLPAVEFLADVPRDTVAVRRWNGNDDAWELGHGREWLPVRNPRPLRVDVVLNLSDWLDPQGRNPRSAFTYRQRLGRLFQIGSVLSHLGVERGCVHVSGVDIHHMRVVFDRADAAGFDWRQARAALAALDQNTIDLSTLEDRTRSAQFFRRFLSDVMFNTGGCGVEREPVQRAVIVAGGSHLFPAGTRVFGVWPEMPCDCRFYYLRADAAPADELEHMLRPVQPRRFQVTSSLEFRKALAQIIADLEREAPLQSPGGH